MRLAMIVAMVLLTVGSYAQLVPQASASEAPTKAMFRVRLGYGFTSEFVRFDNKRGHLEGPEVALSIPLGEMRGLALSLEPSVLLGGRLTHGSDTDGEVYRFLLVAETKPKGSPVTFKAGFGPGMTQSRGVGFKDVSDWTSRLGVAYELGKNPLTDNLQFEVGFHLGGRAALRGFSLGISSRF